VGEDVYLVVELCGEQVRAGLAEFGGIERLSLVKSYEVLEDFGACGFVAVDFDGADVNGGIWFCVRESAK
jgi:hypothetical protein